MSHGLPLHWILPGSNSPCVQSDTRGRSHHTAAHLSNVPTKQEKEAAEGGHPSLTCVLMRMAPMEGISK